MKLTSPTARRIAATTIACTAILLPAAALAAASPAAAAGAPAVAARPAHPVTAYVEGSSVIPINTVTNKAGKAIEVGGEYNFAIAITPNGKTIYAGSLGHVTPIRTATNKAGKPISVEGLP